MRKCMKEKQRNMVQWPVRGRKLCDEDTIVLSIQVVYRKWVKKYSHRACGGLV